MEFENGFHLHSEVMSVPIPIPGVRLGHAVDKKVETGVTACIFDQPAVTSVHIMGAAPGTRDTELLQPEFTVSKVDALTLSGGSAYGLDAAGGVQAWLRSQGRGIALDPVRIPIVPAAILFDMRNDGDKEWGQYSPYRELGYQAAAKAETQTDLGRVGAAFGARTATTPGGLGMASARVGNATIMAIAAVNAAGSPLVGRTDHFWAAPFEEHSEFGGRGYPHPWPEDAKHPVTKAGQRVAGANTTLAIVITDARLEASQAKRLAVASHDGFARALYPVHTPADGDLVFASSTGQVDVGDEVFMDLGIAAGNVTARAIAVGVYHALKQAEANHV